MARRRRKKIHNKPKINISPKIGYVFVISIFAFASLFFTFFIDPSTPGAIAFFIIFIFGIIYSTLSLLTNKKIFTLITTLSVILFMVLSTINLGNILNLLLIAGIAVAAILWFNQSHR